MKSVRILLLAGTFLLPAAVTSAQTAPPAPAIGQPAAKPPGKKAESLLVLNAKGAKLEGKTLTLDAPAKSGIVFTDRPARHAGYLPLGEILALWTNGSFAKDPPNATISAFAEDGGQMADAVVTLMNPRVSGDKITFDVAVLEGNIDKANGPAVLFIDTIWFGMGGGDGIHYLGSSNTTGGTTPSIGTQTDNGTPQGWSNPAPDGTSRSTTPAWPDPAPLTVPPGSR